MKTTTKSFKGLFVTTLILIALACSKDDSNEEDPTEPSIQTLAEVLASAGEIQEVPTDFTREVIESTAETQNEQYDRKDSLDLGITLEQRWVCTEKEVDILGGTRESSLYNPNAAIIWPGNLLQYNTLDKGTPSEIVIKRAGGTITYDLNVGNATATVSVDAIDLGSVNQAMNTIIENNGDITPADFSLEVVAINSKEELAFEMGLNVSTLTTKVDSNFSLDTNEATSSVLVKLRQRYYTMSYVKPTSLDEVFDPSVTAEQLAKFVQPGNPATFISSVTYGRIFYMLYESTASAQDMKSALEGTYGFLEEEVSGSVDLEKLREYNNLTVKVIAYGGDSEDTLEAVGEVFGGENAVDNLQEIVKRLAFAGDIRSGKPLSYVVNSLDDPSLVVATNLATRYTIKNCEYRGIIPPNLYKGLVDLFDNGIGAMFQVRDSDIIVFSKEGNKYAWFNGNAGTILGDGQPAIFDIKDPDAPLGTLVLDAIGSAMHMFGETVVLTDLSGTLLQTFIIDPHLLPSTGTLPNGPIGAGSPNTQPVNLIFGNRDNYQIGTFGVEALVRVGEVKSAFFAKPGDFYQIYETTDNEPWTRTYNSTMWFGGRTDATKQGGTVFERVGAVARFSLGFSGNDPKRYLFVNEAGNEILEWFAGGKDKDRIEGPWVIN